MDIRNCKICGKMYNHISGQNICGNCKKRLEDKFKVVKLYIRKNPKASLTEISDKCDVDVRQIRQWVREERLSFSKDSAVGIECEMCGTNIRSGRFCPHCKETLISGIESHTKRPVGEITEKEIHDVRNRMRFENK